MPARHLHKPKPPARCDSKADRASCCDGKAQFDSYADAVAWRTRAGDVYRCRYCGYWHRSAAK